MTVPSYKTEQIFERKFIFWLCREVDQKPAVLEIMFWCELQEFEVCIKKNPIK